MSTPFRTPIQGQDDDADPSASTNASYVSSLGSLMQSIRKDMSIEADDTSGEQDAAAALFSAEEEFLSKRVQRSLKLFGRLERLITLGVVVCMDISLYFIAVVPLKAILSLFVVVFQPRKIKHIPKHYMALSALLLLNILLFTQLDISWVYHNVRGQSTIKLYVIINLVDVFDRLCASFSQDIFDVLTLRCYSTDSFGSFLKLIVFWLLAFLFLVLHTSAILVQLVALNVAINSNNQSLLPLLISNQFMEIKSAVFKRCDIVSLFQITCADLRERFQFVLILTLIAIRNMSAYGWQSAEFYDLAFIVFLTYVSEVFVDYFKHAFVVRFNALSTDLYYQYEKIICEDIVGLPTMQLLSEQEATRTLTQPMPSTNPTSRSRSRQEGTTAQPTHTHLPPKDHVVHKWQTYSDVKQPTPSVLSDDEGDQEDSVSATTSAEASFLAAPSPQKPRRRRKRQLSTSSTQKSSEYNLRKLQRRLGFMPLPMVCIAFKLCGGVLPTLSGRVWCAVIVCAMILAIVARAMLHMVLVKYCMRRVKQMATRRFQCNVLQDTFEAAYGKKGQEQRGVAPPLVVGPHDRFVKKII
eukprot:m.262834 g.262834  ORF g.262834 m.262834 type:complete len:581 (+) comp15597_c0_seq1:205-1947(+)